MVFQTGDVVELRTSLEIRSGRIERLESDQRALVRWDVRTGHVGEATWHDVGGLRLIRRPLRGS